MQTVSITEAKMADLVSFFNTHAVRLQDGKKVNKFADRPTAEKRVKKLIDSLCSYFPEEDGKTIPPEGFIFVGDIIDEETGETVEVAASTVSPVAQIANGHDETAEQEEEDEQPQINSFGAMAATMGEKPAPVAVARSSAGGASNSLGVALSWKVTDVRERRLTRDSVEVTVDGVTTSFKSTRAAFRAFRLPESKHIRFRLKLKATGAETYIGDDKKSYAFQIIEGGGEEIDE